jgi:DNA repair protein RadC
LIRFGLCKVFGYPAHIHTAVRMERAQSRRVRIIDSLEAAQALFAPALTRARDERLYVAHLDIAHRLIGVRIRFAAEREPVDFPVRGIIADAIALGGAEIVLAHNHPSGDPAPSATDIESTRSLLYAARPIGLTVRDHLIFGGGRVCSFRALGLL